jgi:hypothetical protein
MAYLPRPRPRALQPTIYSVIGRRYSIIRTDYDCFSATNASPRSDFNADYGTRWQLVKRLASTF